MEKKTSSVEWLVEKLTPANWTKEQMQRHFSEIIQQAKEMHEHQMIDFAKWFNNRDNSYQSYEDIVKQYYNETFKG